MKVILKATVPHLGTKGQTKDVKPGYFRNFLFPRHLVILPSDPAVKALRREAVSAVEVAKKQKAILAEFAEGWRGKTFTLKARAGADGTLYGSIGQKEVKKLLGRDDLAFELDPIKTVGTHKVDLVFADGTRIPVVLSIQNEDKAIARGNKERSQ